MGGGLKAVAVAAALVASVALSGCGDSSRGSLEDVLAYVPRDAAAVAVVSTDIEDERYDELNGELGKRLMGGDDLEETARGFAKEAGVPFDDLKDMLGNDLVAAITDRPSGGDEVIAALEVRDVGKLRELLEKFEVKKSGELSGADVYGELASEGGLFALDGDVVVYAQSREALTAALQRADGDDGLPLATFEAATRDLGPEESILRVYGNPLAVLGDERLRRFGAIEWVGALRAAGFTADIDGDRLELRARLDTDPAGLTDADLPLATGTPSPPVAELAGTVGSATANQSQTTAWMLKAVRAAYPKSDFVRHVAELERDLGIDFEQEFLRQFDGPSTSTLRPDGRFAARSTVRDPDRLRELMERLAPRLPQLILDLQALDTEGLVALFLVAPDAPIATRTFRKGGIEVTDLGTGLYEVRGLEPPAPTELVFGLIGDVFVVAADEAAAREIARAPAKPVDGLSGASVARGDLKGFGELLNGLGLPPLAGEATGSVQITRSRLTAEASVELKGE